MSRERPKSAPRASKKPLHNHAGTHAPETKAANSPQLPGIPTGISAARRTSPKRPSSNLRRAHATKASASGTPQRPEISSRYPGHFKNAGSAAAPVSKTPTVGAHDDELATQIQSGSGGLYAVTRRILLRRRLTGLRNTERFRGNRGIRRTGTPARRRGKRRGITLWRIC